MHANQIIKCIDRGLLQPFAPTFRTRQEAPPTWHELAGILGECIQFSEKFEFPKEFLNADVDYMDDIFREAQATCHTLAEHGLLHLPYSLCYMETDIKVQLKGGKLRKPIPDSVPPLQLIRLAIMASDQTYPFDKEEPQATNPLVALESLTKPETAAHYAIAEGVWRDKPPRPDHKFILATFIQFPSWDGTKVWRLPNGLMKYFDSTPARPIDFSIGDLDFDAVETMTSQLQVVAVKMVELLITLLKTRGTSQEIVQFKKADKRKAHLIHRPSPENTFRRIIIKPTTQHMRSGSPLETTRKRTRLHLRRGHYRNQRYGYKRKKSYLRWIDPVLVGYEEEGTIEHEYEIGDVT